MKKILLLAILVTLFGCSFIMDDDSVNPYTEQEESGLPIFYIHPKPVSKDYYSPVTIIYKGHEYEGEGKIRGASTAYYPKKSYTLRFSEDDLFSDSSLGDSGFNNREKILLLADFDDNSHLRNRIAQKMWALMHDGGDGTYQSPVVQTDSAVVYTNGEYEGMYTVIESIDENYLERCASGEVNPLADGLTTGGNLFKALTHDANFYIHDELYTGFEKKSGYPEMGTEGAYDDLIDFIYFINDSSDSELEDSESGFESTASLDSYYGWWFFTTLIDAGDAMAKNAYHYNDPNGPWYYIPWDFNESLGQDGETNREPALFKSYYTTENAISERLVALSSFSEEQNAVYATLLADGGNWDIDDLLAEIDAIWEEIEDAANRDWSEWKDKYMDQWDRDDYTTPEEEVAYIKEWISEVHSLALSYVSD